MAEPASWIQIRPGWKVYAADGEEVGEVDEVAGDDTVDIFDGLAVALSALGRPRYVPAEQIAEITEGAVRLSLTSAQVEALGEYLEPATSAHIDPGDRAGIGAAAAAGLREVESELLHPIQRHQGPMSIWRRLYFFVRRLMGR